jgi:uncharacterized protein YfeS
MDKTVHLYRYTKQMPYVEFGQDKGAICGRSVPRKFFEKSQIDLALFPRMRSSAVEVITKECKASSVSHLPPCR